jgi:hypothetical protein
MSQDSEPVIEVPIQSLPPSYALYLPGAVVVPVIVRPSDPPEVFVPPILFSPSIIRIHWTLVLLSEAPSLLRAEFKANGGIEFTKLSGDVVPMIHPVEDLSPTQVSLKVFTGRTASRVMDHYDLWFYLRGLTSPRSSSQLYRSKMGGDPAVSITPDPIDVPSWP